MSLPPTANIATLEVLTECSKMTSYFRSWLEEDREVVVIESVVEYSLGPCIHGERCAGCPLVAVVVEVRRLLEPVEPTPCSSFNGGNGDAVGEVALLRSVDHHVVATVFFGLQVEGVAVALPLPL